MRSAEGGVPVAYLYTRVETKPGESVRQIPVTWDDGPPKLIIDLDANGEVLGIEFLNANELLGVPPEGT